MGEQLQQDAAVLWLLACRRPHSWVGRFPMTEPPTLPFPALPFNPSPCRPLPSPPFDPQSTCWMMAATLRRRSSFTHWAWRMLCMSGVWRGGKRGTFLPARNVQQPCLGNSRVGKGKQNGTAYIVRRSKLTILHPPVFPQPQWAQARQGRDERQERQHQQRRQADLPRRPRHPPHGSAVRV